MSTLFHTPATVTHTCDQHAQFKLSEDKVQARGKKLLYEEMFADAVDEGGEKGFVKYEKQLKQLLFITCSKRRLVACLINE